MLCNITQNAMGQTPGGVPGQVQLEGVPIFHNALQHYPEFHGADTWGGGYPDRSSWGGYPARSGWGVPCGGYPGRVPPGQVRMGGTLLGGTQVGFSPQQGTHPLGQVRMGGGGTQLGQQKEYSLHGGWYASCVHAGGLSCFYILLISI